MTFLQAIVLGIFQGITEFLPISSSGHLVVLQNFFGIKEGNLFFTEMLHFGTLISIFIVYFNDIIKIIAEFFKMLGQGIKNKKIRVTNIYQKMAILIILGSIPTAIIGLVFKDTFEKLYNSILAISIAFLITGFILWFVDKKSRGNKDIKDMNFIDSILIGIFQGAAIAPGISRSGSTIAGGLFRGLNRKLATEFSFLLALPATFGAGLLGIKEVIDTGSQTQFSAPLVVGVIVSTIVGVISIRILIKLLENEKLYYFSYYLWALGIILLFTQMF
ncbi:undecaprenyl-diphosphatase UppP [Anaerosalibacter bizertensis]|uniref:Undecaprenyl-diphosphatase n=1 Tax=Anaerosalibacter bizertensis TaxID=932217 RepID=A0A844FG75_9FIRM|nr:undecaprenyl-diphosphatase UppP [Anaerosalibacter bizertensis]MBV1818578.1 undecaprenyl-diphosphatase UppP [Bacteroidales bacterium MSK.15.36]HHV27288.1 undecaprenyl-diphosphatase UppP [Tissierellia bacterium]MBU5293242.1 undecaprenyl-diphosphatase UppP [Anaerosalibacter bizertensis]MCB5558767.1 undecaprenyl-diphosphatase UppP [Anaerosalibacter bizertensis]MCG4564599.1 undecaprenyl-diphosphatase UppP [Anaerosalibacter bizertensis]